MTTISASAPVRLPEAPAIPAAAALQATLEQLQHRLSDCVNCDSAATPQGKADIARIEAQIGLVRQRLAEPVEAPPASPRPASATLGNKIDVYV
jgi:hypothetical protein